MLGALLAALRGGDALDKAFGEFDEMLTAGQWMFHEVHGVLAGGDPADVREAVFTRDQDINRLLRSLRGNIVTHLSVNRNADIAACLALPPTPGSLPPLEGLDVELLARLGLPGGEGFHGQRLPRAAAAGELDNGVAAS